MATHSSILAWRIPWTEEPARLQSMGSQSDTIEVTEHTCTMKVKLEWDGQRWVTEERWQLGDWTNFFKNIFSVLPSPSFLKLTREILLYKDEWPEPHKVRRGQQTLTWCWEPDWRLQNSLQLLESTVGERASGGSGAFSAAVELFDQQVLNFSLWKFSNIYNTRIQTPVYSSPGFNNDQYLLKWLSSFSPQCTALSPRSEARSSGG